MCLCVDTRVGKGWAKGLTAATDPRIARMAASRRGRKRGHYHLRARPPLVWSPEVAYAVGLIATDGDLTPMRRSPGEDRSRQGWFWHAWSARTDRRRSAL